MNETVFRHLALGCVLAFSSAAHAAVIAGQIDSFSSGTGGWSSGAGGNPTPPAVVSGGGPGGAADPYLQVVSSGGQGPGSKLSVINTAQWAGDYVGAGVKAISMDLNNMGPDDLSLRLLAVNLGAMGPIDLALSSDPIFLPSGSGWTTVTFSLRPGDLTAGPGTAEGALGNATELRLFHNPDPSFPGPGAGPPPVVATLGVDNIQALIPEPSSLALAAVAGIALFCRGRRQA